jgi:hypothetical protein
MVERMGEILLALYPHDLARVAMVDQKSLHERRIGRIVFEMKNAERHAPPPFRLPRGPLAWCRLPDRRPCRANEQEDVAPASFFPGSSPDALASEHSGA